MYLPDQLAAVLGIGIHVQIQRCTSNQFLALVAVQLKETIVHILNVSIRQTADHLRDGVGVEGTVKAFFRQLQGCFTFSKRLFPLLQLNGIADAAFEQQRIYLAFGQVEGRARFHRFNIYIVASPTGKQNERGRVPPRAGLSDQLNSGMQAQVVIHQNRVEMIGEQRAAAQVIGGCPLDVKFPSFGFL